MKKQEVHILEEQKRVFHENAIALELGVALIDNNSKYLMTLQNDTCVTSEDWLDESLLKISQGFALLHLEKKIVKQRNQ